MSLQNLIAQEDAVIFVGSGVSTWAGLPTWSALIEALAEFLETSGQDSTLVRSEAKRGDLLQAASYGFDKLTKHQIGEFVRKQCMLGIAQPSALHKQIVTLGPRCFITTNYDNLLEESLRRHQPSRFYRPPVTNRHLSETAEIVHARAVDFVFKPHGDAADSESIILTREQYRQLLPGGERHAALEAVKMLLASRPVLYIGFGLRDPDFIYLRDLLANTFKGGTRDHYGIIPDVTQQECDYWRKSYGIHLIPYTTKPNLDGTRDHTALLTLVQSLGQGNTKKISPPDSSAMLLTLARHAAALTRTPKKSPEFTIRVLADKKQRRPHHPSANSYHYATAATFLENFSRPAILVGLPGSGKTYSLKRAAASIAERLHTACLSEACDMTSIVVPVFADLKLYEGSLGMLFTNRHELCPAVESLL